MSNIYHIPIRTAEIYILKNKTLRAEQIEEALLEVEDEEYTITETTEEYQIKTYKGYEFNIPKYDYDI